MRNEYLTLFILAVIIISSNTATAIGTEILDVGSATLDADSTTTVQVNIANAVDLTGISLDISYDPNIIELIGVSANNDAVSGSAITSNIDNAEGKVRIILTNTDLINTINSVPIINIAMHTIGDAGDETTLILQNVRVTDTSFSSVIPKTITNGYVKINQASTPGFGFVLTMLTLFLITKFNIIK